MKRSAEALAQTDLPFWLRNRIPHNPFPCHKQLPRLRVYAFRAKKKEGRDNNLLKAVVSPFTVSVETPYGNGFPVHRQRSPGMVVFGRSSPKKRLREVSILYPPSGNFLDAGPKGGKGRTEAGGRALIFASKTVPRMPRAAPPDSDGAS